MARYAMLKKAIADSGGSHFAWINICIERMGIRNVQWLDDALSGMRRKFSTCRIGYARPSLDDLGTFYGKGGCSDASSSCGGCTFCSGFFTGHRETMVEVCDRMESRFFEALSLGYGHADEQIMALVHAEHPDLFSWYIGDYAQMITNYSTVRESPDAPLYNLILPSVQASDWETAGRATRKLWRAYKGGDCVLGDASLRALLHAMREVKAHT
jgi:hypothetical protein